MRKTVRFSQALDTVLSLDNPVLIEAGPGNTCTTLAWQHEAKTPFTAIASLDKKEITGSYDVLFNALGKAWLAGLNPDWKAFYGKQQRKRIDLPAYSYHKKRYWVEPKNIAEQIKYTTIDLPNTNTLKLMRKDTLIEKIKHLLENASGIEMDGVTPQMSFIEIGLDSLLMTQVAITLKKEFSLPISFRQLNEEYSTIDALATYIDKSLPQETVPKVPALTPVYTNATLSAGSAAFSPADTALGLIAQQLQLLTKQVELMSGSAPSNLSDAGISAPIAMKEDKTITALSAEELAEIKKPFGATARIEKSVRLNYSPNKRASYSN
ncbi:phosphopantetheine-binding protein [Pedobacter sp. NJ-S-72]